MKISLENNKITSYFKCNEKKQAQIYIQPLLKCLFPHYIWFWDTSY